MTAARKPKTPSMVLKVRPGTDQEDIDTFCKKASRVTLSQVVESVTVNEEYVVNGDARNTQLTVVLHFFPEDEYRAEYGVSETEILATFGTKFPLVLKKEIQAELKKLNASTTSQITDLGKGRKSKDTPAEPTAGDDDEGEEPKGSGSGDDDSDAGDGDAGDAKRARQKQQDVSYDDPDDSDMEDLDDAAIEAEFDKVDQPEEGAAPKAQKKPAYRALIGDMFKRNLSLTKEFKFSAAKCTFKLMVCAASSNPPLTH